MQEKFKGLWKVKHFDGVREGRSKVDITLEKVEGLEDSDYIKFSSILSEIMPNDLTRIVWVFDDIKITGVDFKLFDQESIQDILSIKFGDDGTSRIEILKRANIVKILLRTSSKKLYDNSIVLSFDLGNNGYYDLSYGIYSNTDKCIAVERKSDYKYSASILDESSANHKLHLYQDIDIETLLDANINTWENIIVRK